MKNTLTEQIHSLAQRIAEYNNAIYPPVPGEETDTVSFVTDLLDGNLSLHGGPATVYGNLLSDYGNEYFTETFDRESVHRLISDLASTIPSAVTSRCTVFFKDGDAIFMDTADAMKYIPLDSFSHAEVWHNGIDRHGEVGEIYDYTIRKAVEPTGF